MRVSIKIECKTVQSFLLARSFNTSCPEVSTASLTSCTPDMANLDKATFFKYNKFTKASKLSKLLSKLLLKLLTSAVMAVYLLSYCLEQVAFLRGIELAPHWSVGRADVLLESVRISVSAGTFKRRFS